MITKNIRFGLLTLSLASAIVQGASAQEPTKIEIVPNIGHFFPAKTVAFSPDGARVLSGSSDESLKLWDTATGQLIRTFEGHVGDVTSVVFSPDGSNVLSAGGFEDRTIKLWNTTNGELIRVFKGHSSTVNWVAFSQDGTRVLSGSGNQWTDKPAEDDRTLKLWDAATGQLLRTFEGHVGAVMYVAFSRDANRAVSGGRDKTLKVWDVATGAVLRTIEMRSDEIYSVVFSPDGGSVVSGGKDKILRLWDVATGDLLRVFEGHTDAINSVSFSPDGAKLLSGSHDRTLRLWDRETGQSLRIFRADTTNSVLVVAYSADGMALLAGYGSGELKLWNPETGELLRTFERTSESVPSVAVARDGRRVITGGKSPRLWDTATGRLLHTFEGHNGQVYSVAFSPEGRHVLSGGVDKALKLWDAATGQLIRTFEGHDEPIHSVAFSPDGSRILSGTAPFTGNRRKLFSQKAVSLRLWDTASGRLLATLPNGSASYSVAFSRDGARLLTGTYDGVLNLWDAATGQVLRTFGEKTYRRVSAVAFSPDGKRLLSGSWNRTIKLWDAETGQLLRTFRGHAGNITSVAFSPDGSRVLSGSWDNSLGLWDVATGRQLRSFEGHAGWVQSATFSPDGTRVFSSGTDGTVRIWNLNNDQSLATLIAGRDGGWLAMTPAGFYAASERNPKVLSIVRGVEVTSVAQVSDHLYRPDLVEQMLKGDPELKYESAAHDLNLYKIFDSGPPPQVEAIPGRKGEIAGDTVRLAARIVDTGGGIGDKVVWRVNGVTQGTLTGGSRAGVPLSFRVVEQTLRIDPSKRNNIELVAYNKEGLLAALPQSFVVDRYITTEPRPNMHILAIGVSAYAVKDWQLRFAVSDANTFATTLRAAAEPIYPKVNVTIVVDGEATLKGIDSAFKSIKEQVAAQDVFVLFVAGHGRNAAGTYYFLPQDLTFGPSDRSLKTGAIGQEQWQAWLAMIPAQKSILVFDTCESAGAVVLSRGTRDREAAMDRLRFATGRSVIAAARNAAIEGYNGHGVLTYAILDALSGNGDDEVYLAQLVDDIDRKVPEFSQQLTGEPQFPHSRIEGNFPIGVRKTVLKPAPTPIPIKPTHVNVAPLSVFREAGGAGGIAQQLVAFTPVTLVKSEKDWAQIARDGVILGYVPEDKLQRLAQ